MVRDRRLGIGLVIVSAIVFSTAGIFARGVETAAWDIVFWRGVAAAVFTIGYLMFRGTLSAEIAAFKGPALVVTLIGAAGTAAFIPAFKLSSVANVALIYASSPFIAAGLAWIIVGERPTRTVLIASLKVLLGVLLIVSHSLETGGVLGDLLALVMTLMMSGMMVVYRMYPDTTAALPAALSSFVLLPFAMVFGEPIGVSQGELPVLVLFGLVFAVASVTLSEGARRLPPADTALLSVLETPLAPLLALLVLHEMPGTRVLVGGGIILAAVIWSQRAEISR